MTGEKYNGWTNYETWCVNLWLTNDEGTQRHWANAADEAWEGAADSPPFTRLEVAKIRLAGELKDAIELADTPVEMKPGIYSDLLQAALSEVNWDEIAGAFLSGVESAKEAKP